MQQIEPMETIEWCRLIGRHSTMGWYSRQMIKETKTAYAVIYTYRKIKVEPMDTRHTMAAILSCYEINASPSIGNESYRPERVVTTRLGSEVEE
jgi:hypothetical protein